MLEGINKIAFIIPDMIFPFQEAGGVFFFFGGPAKVIADGNRNGVFSNESDP